MALFRLKMQRDIMFFERASRCLFLSDLLCLYCRAAFFREYTVWIAVFVGFVTFVDNLYYI